MLQDAYNYNLNSNENSTTDAEIGGVKQGEETVTDVVSQGGYSSVKVALQVCKSVVGPRNPKLDQPDDNGNWSLIRYEYWIRNLFRPNPRTIAMRMVGSSN